MKELAGMTGVVKVKADHTKECITIQYRGECPSLDQIKTRVEDLGFETGSVRVWPGSQVTDTHVFQVFTNQALTLYQGTMLYFDQWLGDCA
ncbi:MAG: hypothetical protein VX910_09620 [Candidatus Latescibacterota bacterium]|nr:hypothetical protein [Candidatus Latescibacterota bacterium]